MGLLSRLLGRERIGFEKESLAAGIAAGSAKKSIDIIEDNTRRVVNILEERLPAPTLSKEQFEQQIKSVADGVSQQSVKLDGLVGALQQFIESSRVRLESVSSQASRLADSHPSPLMQRVYEAVKARREIAYKELAKETGIDVNSLRSLVSKARKRGLKLETYTVGKEGYVRVVES